MINSCGRVTILGGEFYLFQIACPDGWSVVLPLEMLLKLGGDLKNQMIFTAVTGQLHCAGMFFRIELNW